MGSLRLKVIERVKLMFRYCNVCGSYRSESLSTSEIDVYTCGSTETEHGFEMSTSCFMQASKDLLAASIKDYQIKIQAIMDRYGVGK